jgi:hypothetical protein
MNTFYQFIENINNTETIVQDFLNSDAAKQYANHDCKSVTRAFVKWTKDQKIEQQGTKIRVLLLAPPHEDIIKQRPELKSKKNPYGGGDSHIMPVVDDHAIDFTVRQFGVNKPFNKPLITPLSNTQQVYEKIGGYYTDTPKWFLNGQSPYYLGSFENVPLPKDFNDEIL